MAILHSKPRAPETTCPSKPVYASRAFMDLDQTPSPSSLQYLPNPSDGRLSRSGISIDRATLPSLSKYGEWRESGYRRIESALDPKALSVIISYVDGLIAPVTKSLGSISRTGIRFGILDSIDYVLTYLNQDAARPMSCSDLSDGLIRLASNLEKQGFREEAGRVIALATRLSCAHPSSDVPPSDML